MSDISKIKLGQSIYNIKDQAARYGFSTVSIVVTGTGNQKSTNLVFYGDDSKQTELGRVDISDLDIKSLTANAVAADAVGASAIITNVMQLDNSTAGVSDSTSISVDKSSGKPVIKFNSTTDGTTAGTPTEVVLPLGASGEIALKSQVDAVAGDLAALIGTGDVSAAIDSFNEVVDFLNGIDKTDPTLANQLLGINNRIDAIEAVSGAVDKALSATSTNPVQNKVIKGALDDKANKSELTVTAVTGDTTKKNIQLKSGTSQTVVVEHQDISGKQDKINDLSTIRSGAAKGATSVQTISVNDASLSPTDGNISISAVTGLQFDGSTHIGVVQLPEYVKKSDYDTAIAEYVKKSDYDTTIDGIYQSIPSDLADLADDATHRVVTDTEKSTWNGKQNALTFDNVPTKNSANPVKSGGVYSALADLYDGYDSTTETLSFNFQTE